MLQFSRAIFFAISILNPNYDVINDVISGFAKVVAERWGFHHWIAHRISCGQVGLRFSLIVSELWRHQWRHNERCGLHPRPCVAASILFSLTQKHDMQMLFLYNIMLFPSQVVPVRIIVPIHSQSAADFLCCKLWIRSESAPASAYITESKKGVRFSAQWNTPERIMSLQTNQSVLRTAAVLCVTARLLRPPTS